MQYENQFTFSKFIWNSPYDKIAKILINYIIAKNIDNLKLIIINLYTKNDKHGFVYSILYKMIFLIKLNNVIISNFSQFLLCMDSQLSINRIFIILFKKKNIDYKIIAQIIIKTQIKNYKLFKAINVIIVIC